MIDSLLNPCDASPCKEVESYHDSLIGNLTRKKNRAQEELNAANAALDALQKNPELMNVLELIKKASR